MRDTETGTLKTALRLASGSVLPNRLAKAAMTEGLAGPDGLPDERHVHLYRARPDGGVGLQITGDVMVDGRHLERPGNVIADRAMRPAGRARFRAWADTARAGGGQVWMQVSHTGRQTQKSANPRPEAPSAVALGLPGGQFG